MKIKYNGRIIDVQKGTEIKNIVGKDIVETNAIAGRFNNEIKSLNYKIKEDGELALINMSDKDGMRIYRKGLLYILGMAVEELYPNMEFFVNYQLSNSLLCEFSGAKVTDEMIAKINEKVKEIVNGNYPIEKKSMTKEDARKFYENKNTNKGRLQLELETKKQLSLYWCKEYFNYFYGILPINTGIMKIYEIVKYHDRILVRYPSKKDITKLPQFKENEKLLATLEDYDVLHKVLEVPTLKELNQITRSNKISEYIQLDEALHEKKIANIADDIVKNKNIKMVLIAGPSSSGKTTFASRLGVQLRINGLKPVTISVDNYFVERPFNPKDENGNYDFECIEALDTELFNNHILKLLNCETIEMPEFDFEHGTKRYNGNYMSLAEDEILVVEGIHCLNDKLTELIPKEQKYKIYISCLTVLNIDEYNRISTTDSRLIRRIVRDYKYRGYKALHTLQMWDSVVRGEEKNIFPYQEEANVMFNSSLIYELGVLKEYAIPLLQEIDRSNPEYSEAKRLLRMLGYFETIPSDDIPKNSLLREFIGN